MEDECERWKSPARIAEGVIVGSTVQRGRLGGDSVVNGHRRVGGVKGSHQSTRNECLCAMLHSFLENLAINLTLKKKKKTLFVCAHMPVCAHVRACGCVYTCGRAHVCGSLKYIQKFFP